jgi:hypothetical protein
LNKAKLFLVEKKFKRAKIEAINIISFLHYGLTGFYLYLDSFGVE